MYRRRCLEGYALPISYAPPDIALQWLADRLSSGKGMSNQHDAMVHDVLNVWRHEEIDKRRVSLLCCVGDRQALYLMDYAMAFDRFMCELYGQNDGEHSHSRDVSAWTERRSAWRWDRWADAAREQIGWLDGSEAADYGLTVGQLDRLKNKLRKCLQR